MLENAKSVIFGTTSMFPGMQVGAVLSKSGIIGGFGGMGSDAFKGVGGIGSDVLTGVGQTTGELFTVPGKAIDAGLSMLGLETPGIGIGTGISALGTGLNSLSQVLGSGVSTLTDGLGGGSKHYADSLDAFFSGDISSSIGGLTAGTGFIVEAGLDGIGDTAVGLLGGIGLRNTGNGIAIGIDALGTGFDPVGQGLVTGLSKQMDRWT